jgi:hypothetical protein
MKYLEVQDCDHCPRREYSSGLAGDYIWCCEERRTISPGDTQDKDFPKWCPLKSKEDLCTE